MGDGRVVGFFSDFALTRGGAFAYLVEETGFFSAETGLFLHEWEEIVEAIKDIFAPARVGAKIA